MRVHTCVRDRHDNEETLGTGSGSATDMEEEDIGDDQGSSSVAASTISSGATGAGGGTGVFECPPRGVPHFRVALPLGSIELSSTQIEKVVWDLAREYPADGELISSTLQHIYARN